MMRNPPLPVPVPRGPGVTGHLHCLLAALEAADDEPAAAVGRPR
jgi:hypothetical protein